MEEKQIFISQEKFMCSPIYHEYMYEIILPKEV